MKFMKPIHHQTDRTWLILLVIPLLTGCAGYQLGSNTLYRPNIRTVHVPMFQSDSFRRNLGEQLTEAVCKQIEKVTPYKVVSSAQADTILNGRIIDVRKHVMAEDALDQPRNVEVNYVVQISWLDRQGQNLIRHAEIPLPDPMLNIGQEANFVAESGQSLVTAQQELVRKLARQIVSQMEMPW
tara:strand:- start:75 stop:623 length:549 start_codon:yes stop_codon:yes gene_type:complete